MVRCLRVDVIESTVHLHTIEVPGTAHLVVLEDSAQLGGQLLNLRVLEYISVLTPRRSIGGVLLHLLSLDGEWEHNRGL